MKPFNYRKSMKRARSLGRRYGIALRHAWKVAGTQNRNPFAVAVSFKAKNAFWEMYTETPEKWQGNLYDYFKAGMDDIPA